MDKFKRPQDWVNMVLGLWVAVTPLFMTYAGGSGFTIFWGILIILIGLWALAKPESKAAQWCMLIAGVVLFIMPWLFGISGGAAWSAWIVGIIIVVLSGMLIPKLGEKKKEG